MRLITPSLPNLSFLRILPAQVTHCHSPSWPHQNPGCHAESFPLCHPTHPTNYLPNIFWIFMFSGITINAVLKAQRENKHFWEENNSSRDKAIDSRVLPLTARRHEIRNAEVTKWKKVWQNQEGADSAQTMTETGGLQVKLDEHNLIKLWLPTRNIRQLNCNPLHAHGGRGRECWPCGTLKRRSWLWDS